MMEDYKLEDDGFPPVECLVDFFLEGKWDFTVAPALISGVLRQGHKMLLAGPSKAGKSFALIELALCLASGKPWLGRFECTAGKVMYVNLRGYFLCAKYALDLLKKSRHGAIVCTASELGVVGCVESLAYNTSKGGVLQFVKSLALELAEFGIRVNAVCPAGTVTPAFVRDMSRTGDYDRECRELVAEYPLGRLGMPDDIAKAVAFLASEDASFITGTHLMVDGGFTAH